MEGNDGLKGYFGIIREHNLRVTPQRELILELLRKSNFHPTAEIIYVQAKKRYSGLSFNTVYRTLDLFEQKGLVKRFGVGENSYRYDGNINPHAHFFCMECNRLNDIDGEFIDLIQQVGKDAGLNYGVEVIAVELFIQGICKECKRR